MRNEKFIIYNKTTSFSDYEVFQFIEIVLKNGLISGDNNLYCYASTFKCWKGYVSVEFMKTKYGYKIYVYEEGIDRMKEEK